ncbi:MAG TPA: VIT1/CCC1 transporter family protein [Bacteroidales bacterium]|jgi:VIT1/CCC1 family predicted Fe2+/Mn2+ transporter|nr:VIT1/CCC1 transporter family protein [Bacteroidales bacterium]
MKDKAIQTEVDAYYLYGQLAKHEQDKTIASVFKQMSEIEKGHAIAMAKQKGLDPEMNFSPSWRAKILNFMGKVFGDDIVLSSLMDTEKSLSHAILTEKKKRNINIRGSETNHVAILQTIFEREGGATGKQLSRFERRHRTIGGNAIRAAVLGSNDGLVSNFSLVMGVAGAMAGREEILLAGLAGLLAGALSMALGEWISVKSSQELYENQMNIEREELESDPSGEMHELALIYIAKGMSEEEAYRMAENNMKNMNQAYEISVKEELGINPEELKGSPIEAALYSFFLFAFGAVIPIIPFMFSEGMKAITISVGLSALGLFIIGAAITLFTGKHPMISGLRQVLFGLMAAAVTYGIGKWIGVSLLG